MCALDTHLDTLDTPILVLHRMRDPVLQRSVAKPNETAKAMLIGITGHGCQITAFLEPNRHQCRQFNKETKGKYKEKQRALLKVWLQKCSDLATLTTGCYVKAVFHWRISSCEVTFFLLSKFN